RLRPAGRAGRAGRGVRLDRGMVEDVVRAHDRARAAPPPAFGYAAVAGDAGAESAGGIPRRVPVREADARAGGGAATALEGGLVRRAGFAVRPPGALLP